jgi:hypothetical protein
MEDWQSKTVWVEYDLVRPSAAAFSRRRRDRRPSFVWRLSGKCDPEEIGAFTIVKWKWAETNALAFGVAGLGPAAGQHRYRRRGEELSNERDPGSVCFQRHTSTGVRRYVLGAVKKGRSCMPP